MLTLRDVHASYGAGSVLSGVELEVQDKEIVCILGRNGVGKSTTLKCIMGLLVPDRGTITFKQHNITRERTERIARMGIAYVPDDRGLFVDLTVSENLRLAEIGSRSPQREKALEFLPSLKVCLNHKAGSLSGGQQQMLAIARAVTFGGDLLILDEPSEGLAPVIREDLKRVISDMRKEMTILLVEQNLKLAMDLCDRVYIMVHGTVVFRGTPDETRESRSIEHYLMV